MRRKNVKLKDYFERIFGPILREKETTGERLCGASWTFISASIIFFICTEEIAVTSFAILAISDACAAIIGKSFVSKPFFEKSTIGTAAFYISGLLVLFVCGGMFHSRLWFYLFGFFALFCATILEARPSFLNLDDNFSIPVSFALVMSFFDVMWNYNY
jgi:dolichol kinase